VTASKSLGPCVARTTAKPASRARPTSPRKCRAALPSAPTSSTRSSACGPIVDAGDNWRASRPMPNITQLATLRVACG
jgi:hypothetical protein